MSLGSFRRTCLLTEQLNDFLQFLTVKGNLRTDKLRRGFLEPKFLPPLAWSCRVVHWRGCCCHSWWGRVTHFKKPQLPSPYNGLQIALPREGVPPPSRLYVFSAGCGEQARSLKFQTFGTARCETHAYCKFHDCRRGTGLWLRHCFFNCRNQYCFLFSFCFPSRV